MHYKSWPYHACPLFCRKYDLYSIHKVLTLGLYFYNKLSEKQHLKSKFDKKNCVMCRGQCVDIGPVSPPPTLSRQDWVPDYGTMC